MAAATLLGSLATALTPVEQGELNCATSDFLFLLAEHDIPIRVQLKLVRMGYNSIQIFGVWADDRAGVRAAYSASVLDEREAGLAPDQVTRVKLHGNQILAAWMVASLRSIEEVRLATDAKLLRLPVMMSRATLLALRQRYEHAHGRTTDAMFPCAAMLEKRLEEVEEGSFTATPLSEVISIDSSGDEFTTIQEVGVSVRVRKAPKAIPQPTTTEELRSRFETLAISFTIAGYKHSNRLWIRTATLNVWNDYVRYLLSDKVALYHLDQEGISIRASWATVLNYDLQMRKLVCRKVLYDAMDFATALAFAKEDLGCKEQYFITPTAMLASARKVPAQLLDRQAAPPPAPEPAGKGAGKPKAKAKGAAASPYNNKGGKKGNGKTKYKKTPDGRIICRFHNSAAGCNKGNTCQYVNVCNKCLSPEHGAATPCPASA